MVKASASKNSEVMEDVLRVIGEYVNNESKKGIEVDIIEDEHFGNCRDYDQLNESGKHKAKAVVAKYVKQVNKDKSINLIIEKKRLMTQLRKHLMNLNKTVSRK